MRRIAVVSIAALFSALIPAAGHTTPAVSKPIRVTNPSITFVQGWWEQEHRERRAREGYWRFPPPEFERYNQLQAEINELQAQRREIDERLRRALREQHRMLGFER